MKNVREPAVAGTFYPSSPIQLKNELQLLLDVNKPDESYNNVFGIVSPHAGYIYSGRTAAFAYNAVKEKKIDTVVIISPSHREYFPGISIYNGDAYRTPLGDLPIDKKMCAELSRDSKFIFESVQGHRNEHALEVQLPFLQMIYSGFKIVPIVMGDQRKIFVEGLAEKIAEIVNDRTLVIASSDLSHFYTKKEADKLDSVVEKNIAEFNYKQLLHDLDSKNCEACGGGPIAALMNAAGIKGIKKSKVLSRTDSGDVTGDDSEVVGYLSAVIYN